MAEGWLAFCDLRLLMQTELIVSIRHRPKTEMPGGNTPTQNSRGRQVIQPLSGKRIKLDFSNSQPTKKAPRRPSIYIFVPPYPGGLQSVVEAVGSNHMDPLHGSDAAKKKTPG